MKLPKLILVGGGGHCKSVIDVVRLENKYEIKGIIDNSKDKLETEIFNIPIIGTDNDIPHLVKDYPNFFVTIGQIKDPSARVEVVKLIREAGGVLPSIISPNAYISPNSLIGDGTFVAHNVVVNCSAVIGCNCILNTGSIIEHDTKIDDYVHISTNAVVNGGCHINEMSFVGSGAIIAHGICLGAKSIIGASSMVLENTLSGSTYIGSPAAIKKFDK